MAQGQQAPTQVADAIAHDLQEYTKLKNFMEDLGISEPSLGRDIPVAIVIGHLLPLLLQDIMAAPEP